MATPKLRVEVAEPAGGTAIRFGTNHTVLVRMVTDDGKKDIALTVWPDGTFTLRATDCGLVKGRLGDGFWRVIRRGRRKSNG